MTMMNESRGAALSHPLIAEPSHDELVEQLFARDLKLFVGQNLEPTQRAIVDRIKGAVAASSNDPVTALRERMFEFESFGSWVEIRREAQRQLWDAVRGSIVRQADHLEEIGTIENPRGSVTVDPDMDLPEYIAKGDIHLMPGGYGHDDGSLLQGALMDRGGAVYMLGRNGGMLNDLRGHTAMAHVLTLYPDIEPKRILDMGCGIGASTVPAAHSFPDAEVHGIDVGASILRYAHARAEHLGAAIHFSQQDAEHTNFEDGSFDIVFSCVVMHETSQSGIANILKESRRLLRPGGVAVHLEVPLQMQHGAQWEELAAALESEYNNEPYWHGALTADYAKLMEAAGFRDVQAGYQSTATDARTSPKSFGPESQGTFRSWFVTSGRA